MEALRGKPIAILRPFNAYGPGQSTKAIIPELIISFLRGKDVTTTAGEQTREFNFVDDLVEGFILASESQDAIGKIINLGSGTDISIKELANKLKAMTGSASTLHVGGLTYRPTEIWRMRSDNTKAREILKWEPKVSLEDGLTKTIDWFSSFEKATNHDSPFSQLFTLG
jgi:nucleoside-diphosphate-sugar epimerase